jgi:hypothetical protein
MLCARLNCAPGYGCVNYEISPREEVSAMSVRFAARMTVITAALALGLSPLSWAQEETRSRRPDDGQLQNPAGRSERDKTAATNPNQATSGLETIRGAIAGITAEGELVLDFRTNAAARTEGAFLTIVGYATSIVVRPTMNQEKFRSAGDATPNERTQ